MRHWSKRRTLALAAGVYGVLWALTYFVGGPYLRNLSVQAMHLPEGLAGFTEISNARQAPRIGRAFYCRTFAYAPFVVRVDHGWVSGSLSGDGGSELYLWMPGVALRLYELEHWAI